MRVVNRDYLIELVDEHYKQKQSNCLLYIDKNWKFFKKTSLLEEELRLKKLNTLNSDVIVWKISYYKNDPSILTIFQNIMTDAIEVKYIVANNSIHATERKKGAIGSAGYDLFAEEEKIIIPSCVTPITIELKMEIPTGYFGKVYPRSSLLKNFFVSCDAGVIDPDFRGTVLLLMTNNSKDPKLIKPGQRIAQIVFHKNEEVVFKKVDCLSTTERGDGSFGSTGI